MSETSCRFCLGEVHPDDRGSSILEALFRSAIDRVFSFEIKHDENLPIYTCNDCSQQVWDFNSYSQLVQKNQNTLEQRLLQTSRPSNSAELTEGVPLQPIDPDKIKKEAVTSDEESETPPTAPDQVLEGCGLLSAIKTEPTEPVTDVETLLNQFVIKSELSIDDADGSIEVDQAVENVTASETAPTYDTAGIKESDGSDMEAASNDDNDSDDDDDDEASVAQSEETTIPSPNGKNLIEKMRERIRERIAAHKGEFRCNICDRTYPNERYLKTHNDVVHAPYIRRRSWFPCDLCNRSFLQQSLLNNHRKTHTQPSSATHRVVSAAETDPGTDSTSDQYAFRCNGCPKTFSCHKSLRTHVDVMHPEMARQPQSYSCDHCDRTFDDRKKLNKHRRVHKFQQCTVCMKQLLKQNIRQHMRAHEGEFRCELCSKALSCSKSLKRHLETVHASAAKRTERPYSCPLCPRTFYHIAHMQNHRQQHIMQRCPLCHKTIRKSYLFEHIAGHKGAFRCKPCDKLFTSKLGWKIHSKQKHGQEV